MKYLFTLFLGYVAPSIIHSINLDIVLGVTAGILLGLLVAMLMYPPTPAPRHDTVKATVRKPTQRRIINSTAKQPAYVFVPQNYPQGAYA